MWYRESATNPQRKSYSSLLRSTKLRNARRRDDVLHLPQLVLLVSTRLSALPRRQALITLAVMRFSLISRCTRRVHAAL